jgi:hypothetical protein
MEFFEIKLIQNHDEDLGLTKILPNIKENYLMENFLFNFKNEFLSCFSFYKNFLKYKIDYDFKSLFLENLHIL